MKSIYSVVLLGACLAMSTAATAAVPAEAQPSPPPPEVTYRSAFADYKPFREEPPADWRTLNEAVGEAGGHIGIMRGAKPAVGNHRSNNPPAEPVKSAPTRGTDTHGH